MNQKYDVIVIGGGASGLMCAITAAQRGRRVLVLESSNKVGKKILMSGGGRCNFTNLYVEPENFISNNKHFCKSALSRYTQWDFISWVNSSKIEYEERKHGQLFCKHSAKDILAMLLNACAQHEVTIKTHCTISKVIKNSNTQDNSAIENNTNNSDTSLGLISNFELESNLGDFECHSLVVASGALSIPTLGASGFGYELAKQFDLNVLETRASLVPFTFSDYFKDISQRLSGLSVDVILSCGSVSFKEAILFTHRGLSGPAVLQLSNYWQLGQRVDINLFPDDSIETILLQHKQKSTALLRTMLNQYLPKALVLELEKLFWLKDADKAINQFTDKKLTEIAQQLKHWSIKPSGTEGYRTAEVTLGGVDTNEISSKTMETKKHPSLYFIGEVLDVTGHLGGFNFQWAWSSGYVAGSIV